MFCPIPSISNVNRTKISIEIIRNSKRNQCFYSKSTLCLWCKKFILKIFLKNVTKFMCVIFTYAIMSCEKTMIRDYHIYHFLGQTYRSIEYILFFRLLFSKDYSLECSIFIIAQSIVYETSDYSIGLARKEKKDSLYVRQNNSTKRYPWCNDLYFY